MMWIFGIVLISGMKALLCKGFSLGGFLLLFWIKGRQLRFNSDEWDSFFISLPERKLQKYVICIYQLPKPRGAKIHATLVAIAASTELS